MNLTPEKKKIFTKWIIGIATACILIFLGVQNIDALAGALSRIGGIAKPLIMGFAIAVILNVPMRFWRSIFGKMQASHSLLKQDGRLPLLFLLFSF